MRHTLYKIHLSICSIFYYSAFRTLWDRTHTYTQNSLSFLATFFFKPVTRATASASAVFVDGKRKPCFFLHHQQVKSTWSLWPSINLHVISGDFSSFVCCYCILLFINKNKNTIVYYILLDMTHLYVFRQEECNTLEIINIPCYTCFRNSIS